MPPSAEGLGKPNRLPRSERKAAGRRQGKQPGAPGANLAQVVDPDEVVTHAPDACTNCGADLSDAEVTGVERRQVFDLPRIRPFVTEHRIEQRRCACGCEVKAPGPSHATAPACYGPGVRALAAYLAVYQHLPYDRMAQLFSDVLGIEISTGALVQMVAEAGGSLGLFLEVVRDLLQTHRWCTSTRRAHGSPASCTGCTPPRARSSPCSTATSAADKSRWTTSG